MIKANKFIKNVLLWVMFLGVNSFSSDSGLQVFTPQMHDRLSSDQIKKVQFYNSKEIVLKRQISNGESGVSKGEIQLLGGKYFQIIQINKLTPGVCLSEHGALLYISFDTTNRTLEFINGGDAGFPFYSMGVIKSTTPPETTFGGKAFEIVKGSHARLLVKKQEQGSVGKSKELLKGRTVE